MLGRIFTVGGYTLLSRLTGFARDIMLAAILGAGPVADAFFVALRLPNHFRAIFAEGAFNAAFVREIKKVFPDRSLSPLPAASPLFALPNQIKVVGVTPGLSSQLGGKTTIAPNLLGIEVNGQLAVIYSPYGMCGGWEMAQNPYALGYDDAGSLSLGENMLMYTLTH